MTRMSRLLLLSLLNPHPPPAFFFPSILLPFLPQLRHKHRDAHEAHQDDEHEDDQFSIGLDWRWFAGQARELCDHTHGVVPLGLNLSNSSEVSAHPVEVDILGEGWELLNECIEHVGVATRACWRGLKECRAVGAVGSDGRQIGSLRIVIAKHRWVWKDWHGGLLAFH